MIAILTWISIISGGILILLILTSILSGLDFDLDVDGVDTSVDGDSGLGIVKTFLTFVSVTSWTIKIFVEFYNNYVLALSIGILCGSLAVVILRYVLKLLLSNEENVNWSLNDATLEEGRVYLKIPTQPGYGIVHVEINGAIRELKARTNRKESIPTGSQVLVTHIEGEYAIVDIANG